MKNLKIIIAGILFALMFLFAVSSCKKKDPGPEPEFERFTGKYGYSSPKIRFSFEEQRPQGKQWLRVKINDSVHDVGDMGYASIKGDLFSASKTCSDLSVALLVVENKSGQLYFDYGVTYQDASKNYFIQGILTKIL